MASGSIEKWKPGYFEANHLEYLPKDLKLDHDTIVIDYMRKDELERAYTIIECAAENEYNVGTDEFDWDSFVDFTSDVSECFTVRVKGSEEEENIAALLLTHPSIYSRGMAPCIGYFEIFLTPALFKENPDAYRRLADAATGFAADLGLKYVAVMTQVFCPCSEMIMDLRSLDFHLVACLPRAGHLGKRKFVDSYLFYKDFKTGAIEDKVRSLEDIEKYAQHVTEKAGMYVDYEKDTDPLKEYPVLPIKYNFKRAGVKTIWRNIRREDAPLAYKMIQDSAREGVGYSLEEMPTFHFFYHWHFKDQYGLIVEEEGTGKFIAYIGSAGYWPYRTLNPDVVEATLIIAKEYRGKGMAQELAEMSNCLYVELGFKGVLSDTAVVNVAMLDSQQKSGFIRVGVSPKSLYLQNRGYTDSVYSYLSLDRYVPFSQKIKHLSTDIFSKI